MIQIDEVAADARPLIEAFRQAGGLSFEKLGVEAARSAYERSCAANGLPPVASVDSVDMTLGSDGVRVRWYSAPATTASANRPVVLFLHGGGWVIGSLETHDSLCRYLAAQVLVDVVAVDYRLAPEWPYPAAIDDSRAATAALARGDLTGSPPPATAVLGDSAVAGNLEIRSPSLLGWAGAANECRLFGFLDAGTAYVNDALPEQDSKFNLWSYCFGS